MAPAKVYFLLLGVWKVEDPLPAPPLQLGEGGPDEVMSNQPGMFEDKRPRWDPYLQFLEHPSPRCQEPVSAP